MQHSPEETGDHSIPAFTSLADLASARVGGRALAASDDFFAPKSNLIRPVPPIFVPDRFTSRGKWMDGWESRRRRTPGHDWCVVRLGARGRVAGVDIDTSFFTGNYPSHCSIDALDTSRPLTRELAAAPGAPWLTVLPRSALRGNTHNYFALEEGPLTHMTGRDAGFRHAWTHLRLNIYPDGGVARLRVYGEAVLDWARVARSGRAVDLAGLAQGGLVLGASDMHFGAKDNMIMPDRARNMGDGWETRRRRGPGHDWAIVRLGTAGTITRVEIDTSHFKGNYPDTASVEGCLAPGATIDDLDEAGWIELLPQSRLKAHRRHVFVRTVRRTGPVSHVRLNIFPDGGVARLRVYGIVASS